MAFYNNVMPLAGFGGSGAGYGYNPYNAPSAGGSNPMTNYLSNYNSSMARPASNAWAAAIDADAQKYGWNTRANMNLVDNIQA